MKKKYFFLIIIFFLISCTTKKSKELSDLERTYDFYKTGKEKYDLNCYYCHSKGSSGAPPLWNFDEWEKRYNKGLDVMLDNTIKGYSGKNGIMPPRGGCFKCSKNDLEQAIKYMLLIAKVYPPQDSNL